VTGHSFCSPLVVDLGSRFAQKHEIFQGHPVKEADTTTLYRAAVARIRLATLQIHKNNSKDKIPEMDIGALRRRIALRRQSQQEGQQQQQRPTLADKSRVARVLFDPPDHEANMRFVKRELEKAKREAEDRWNFDFENERPIEGGRFHWVSGTASNQLLTEQPSTTPPVDHQSENNSLSPKPGTHSAENRLSPPPLSDGSRITSDDVTKVSAAGSSSMSAAVSTVSSIVSDPATTLTTAGSCDNSRDTSSDESEAVTTRLQPTSASASSKHFCDKKENSSSLLEMPRTPHKKKDPVSQQPRPSTTTTPGGKSASHHQQRSRLKQSQITGHFLQRKRSKSKVKTQERKTDTSEGHEAGYHHSAATSTSRKEKSGLRT